MNDVRFALWAAYKKLEVTKHGIEGKGSEGWCELKFPTFWDCQDADDFLEPISLMIYSYALGPSRSHFFKRGKVDRKVNYYTWEAPDIYAKAVEVINGWADDIKGG
jgi:hypothetical protein